MVARQLERAGAIIHYEVSGHESSSIPLLLTHGFGSSTAMWVANVESLARERVVVTWDLPGHGSTHAGRDVANYSHDACVADMAAILDACGIARATIGGLSLGGYLSLCFHLAHRERVAALILCDCGPGFRDDAHRERWNDYAEATASKLQHEGLDALPASPEARLGARDTTALATAARQTLPQHDARVIESLAAIDVPTLVLVGERDTGFRRAADYMAAHIRGAALSVVSGAGHAANMDEPSTFNATVGAFLDSVGSAPPPSGS